MSTIRPAAVAGMFYPGEPRALAAEVEDLLGGVEHVAPRLGFPKALIVPHAGYIYSDAAYSHLTFQVIGSRLQPGCAEGKIVSTVLDLMRQSGQ